MITVTHRVNLPGTGPVEVPIAEYGSGQPFLLLHGGAGPASVTGFAEKFAAAHQVRVLVPTHPGFGGTARPEKLDSVAGLAPLYQALLDELALSDVTVIGNSIGGWIAAEIALLKSPRVSGIVLIDAVGIEVPGHPVADFFSLSMDQVFQLTFHNPEPFRIDPTALPPRHRRSPRVTGPRSPSTRGPPWPIPPFASVSGRWRSRPWCCGGERRDRGRRLRARLRRRDPHGPLPAAPRDRPRPAAGDPRPGHPGDLGAPGVRVEL